MCTKQFFSLCLILSSVFLSGCGPEMPPGFPKVYPVSLTVTQGDQPLAGATVSLRPTDLSIGDWAIGGKTDENGVVELLTHGYRGAPAGTFKVVVTKTVMEGTDARDEAMQRGDIAAAQRVQLRLWSYVREEYGNLERTPLEVEITKETRTLSVDAGPAIRTALQVPL